MQTNIYTFWASCSTFLLNKGENFLIGHNLDEQTAEAQHGSIFINKRGESKTGISFKQIFIGEKPESNAIKWTSIHGSVTFSSFGKNFIDGGYNETGLYIGEMSQEGGFLPALDERSRMFMSLWMQYVLDNFSTAVEVVQSLSLISIDGWPWHFFVCDANDNRTCIEFIDGKARVYSGADMPYSAVTNYDHDKELDFLKPYQGFGGTQPVDLNDLGNIELRRDTRFIHACHLIKNAPENPDADYAFNMLYAMDRGALSPPGGRHWSYVIDARTRRIYVETRTEPRRRYIDLDTIDFADNKPSLLVDIHIHQEGDIRDFFQEVTPENNRAALERCCAWWEEAFERVMDELGEEIINLIEPDTLDAIRKGSWAKAIDSMAAHIEEDIVS